MVVVVFANASSTQGSLARWFWTTYGHVVPLVPVKSELLKAIVHGETLVESHVPDNSTSYEMFELYGLSRTEAEAAKQVQELPAVLKCYENYFGPVAAEVGSQSATYSILEQFGLLAVVVAFDWDSAKKRVKDLAKEVLR